MDEKNTVQLNINTDSSLLQKQLNRSLGFFKSFVTSFNKTLSKVGNISGISNQNSVSPSETVKKESGAILKKSYTNINPAYGIFDENSGTYSGGVYRNLARDSNNVDHIINNNKKLKESYTELRIVGIYAFRTLSRSFSNAIRSMSTAGAQLYELNSRFGLIMEEMTAEAEEFADKLGEAYGLNEATIKENMLRLYTLGQNAGLANDQALELTKTMSRLGVEVASVWDVPIEQATDNLISALQGLPRAMKKYGSYVGTTEIKEFLNQYRETQGLEPLTRELTRQEKTLGVYLKSLSDLGYSFGDFERTVTSTSNQMRIMQETITTLKQTGGELLNETLSPLLQISNNILKTISNLSKSLLNLPKPLKFVISVLMLFVLTMPTIIGTATLFIYYITKMKESLASLSGYLGTSSKRLLTWGKTLLKVTKWASLIMGFVISLQMVRDAFDTTSSNSDSLTDSLETQSNTAKELKRTLSSFDDVNVFKIDDSTEDVGFGNINMDEFLSSIGLAADDLTELNSLFEESTQWAKVLSVALLSIDILGLLSQFNSFKTALKSVWTWIIKNQQAFGAWSIVVLNGIAVIKNIVDIFKQWSDMSTGQRIVSILTAIASAIFLVASAIAAAKGQFAKSIIFGSTGTLIAAGGSAILSNISKNNTASANNVGSTSNVISSAYNPNDSTSNLGTSISNAVMLGMSNVKTNGDNRPINININVDEEYIYRSYNKVAKQNGVI